MGQVRDCKFWVLFLDHKFLVLYFPICFRYHDTIERYCEDANTWEIVSEMTTSRSWLSCVSLQLRKDIHMGNFPGTPNDS